MKHETRLLLALAVSAAIFFIWYALFPPPQVGKKPAVEEIAVTTDSHKEQSVVLPPEKTKAIKDARETVAEEKLIAIETDVSRLSLSTRGGVLVGYELKDYKQSVKNGAFLRNLVVDGTAALFLGVKGVPSFAADKVYALVSDEALEDGTREIVLRWQNSSVRIDKKFHFGGYKTDYGVDIAYTLTNLSGEPLSLTPFVQNRVPQKPLPKKQGGLLAKLKFEQPDLYGWYTYQNQDLKYDHNWQKFTGNVMASGEVEWAALSDRYFLFALIPGSAPVLTQFDRDGGFFVHKLSHPEVVVPPKGELSGKFTAYIGPKKIAELSQVKESLSRVIDYGWFSVLALPILWLMTFLHKFIPNWGLVIIALTFIVKMLLHPINKKSMQGMKAMQQLQPKLQEIKGKYPDDRQRQQQEIMQLFRTHKVNPMGGCLPLLLQMPIYIVLYKVLWNAIELYHAPFFWIYKDLSAADPYFILPILLGVFMFLQQKLTPTATADNMQKNMMLIMPVMFTVFMLFLPVGLVVYIFVNTVMSVVQQFMIKRELSFKQLITGKWQPNGA